MSTDWHTAYNEDVTYLVNVLKNYGPPLRSKLQQRSLETEQAEQALRRSRRNNRVSSMGLLAMALVAVMSFISDSSVVQTRPTPDTAAISPSSPPAEPSAKNRHRFEMGSAPGDDRDAEDPPLRFAERPDGKFCSDWFPAEDSAGCDGTCLWQRFCTRDRCNPDLAGQCAMAPIETHCGPWPGSCPNSARLDDGSMIDWAGRFGFEFDFRAEVWRRATDGLSLQDVIDVHAGILPATPN
jgi:hypothetical protein